MENTYHSGHPWHYKLGGAVLKPKQILDNVKCSKYQGWMIEDINKVDNRKEPERTIGLKTIRDNEIEKLKQDLCRYREVVCDLHRDRKENGIIQDDGNASNEIHMSMSLKHNHIYNRFAHLVYLDELITHQYDLFDL